MNYICSLNNLEFFAYHGLYEEEKITGGKFIVDISVESTKENNAHVNKLDDVINYEALFNIVNRIMQQSENLIETVAKKIIDETYLLYPNVSKVAVTITKLNPAGLFKSGQATVKLVR